MKEENDSLVVLPIFFLIIGIILGTLTYFHLVENTMYGYGISIILLTIAIGIFYWIYN